MQGDAKQEPTPGPWSIPNGAHRDATTVVGDRPGWSDFVVADCGGSSSNRPEDADLRDQQVANARLIAAAPDMRAALRAEQAWRDFYKTDIDPSYPDYHSATELWHDEERRLCLEADRLRAIALAKVEGRDE